MNCCQSAFFSLNVFAVETPMLFRQISSLGNVLFSTDALSPGYSVGGLRPLLAPASVTAVPFAARSAMLYSSSSQRGRRRHDADKPQEGIVAAEEEFSAITDKIPQRPVSVAEGTSYTLVIIAALGFAAAVLYAAFKELFFSPKEYQCYSHTLERLKDDPRVTVRVGSPVSAYGTESRNRAARQRIPHRIYNDAEGREHIQLQFHLRGPSGRATVNADMYNESGTWRYHFLYLDVQSPLQQQVVLVRPGQADSF
jgi:mitochondrial import inner membrane translocase subunit TIM21